MTDREKLEEIRKMCEAAFSASFTSQDIDLGRAQALANVYGVILYDGATIANTNDAVRQYKEEPEYTLMGLPVQFSPVHGIRLVAFCDIQGGAR